MAANKAYNPKIDGIFEIAAGASTTYHRLHNVTDFSLSGGAAEETTVQTIDHDPVVSVGKPQPKDVSVSILASPATEGYRIALNAYRNGDQVTLRYTSVARQLRDNSIVAQTIAVAATGVATGVMTKFEADANFFAGLGLKVDSTDFIIETITSDTAMTLSRADGGTITAVSATSDWELWEYAIQITLPCRVLEAGSFSVTSGGDGFTDALTLKSTDVLPVPTYVLA